MNFRDEFRLKKLGFAQTVSVQRFFLFHWRLPGLAYVIYRVIAACYCLTWLIYTSHEGAKIHLPWMVFLTSWTYTLETIYFTFHCVFTIYFYFISSQRSSMSLTIRMSEEDHCALFPELNQENDQRAQEYVSTNSDEEFLTETSVTVESPQKLPFYVIFIWILFNCVSSAAIMVSIVFWTVLVPFTPGLGSLSLGNLQLHLVNSILLLIEHSLSAIPIRVMHVIYPVIYGMIYMVFSIFYWVDDHNHVIYKILDWNKPGATVGYILAVGFGIVPIIHLFIYGIYRIKLKILKCC